jgi:hypothetical protein
VHRRCDTATFATVRPPWVGVHSIGLSGYNRRNILFGC